MNHRKSSYVITAVLCLSLLAGLAYSARFGGEIQAAPASAYTVSDTMLASETAMIHLSDDQTTISGSGVVAEGNRICILKEGVYRLSGTLSEGQIYCKVGKKQDLVLILDGVSVTNPEGPALYVEQSGNCAVYLSEGTENSFVSGETVTISADAADDTATLGAVTFKDDATIYGSGVLSVQGYINNGIHSSNNLFIENGSIQVTAVNNGIKGKDSLTVDGGTISVVSGSDGLKSDDETGDGYGEITINGGKITIQSCHDGIQAQTLLTVNGGEIDITTTGEEIVHSEEMFGMMGGGRGMMGGGRGMMDGGRGTMGGGQGMMDDGQGMMSGSRQDDSASELQDTTEEITEEESAENIEEKSTESTSGEEHTEAASDMLQMPPQMDGSGEMSQMPPQMNGSGEMPQMPPQMDGSGEMPQMPPMNESGEMPQMPAGQAPDMTEMPQPDDAAAISDSAQQEDDDNVSTKGIKSLGDLVINGGTITIDSVDDALHCDGDMMIDGAILTLSTQDDGIHADESLTILSGTIDILSSYEGIESRNIVVEDGEISLTASDDGFNASTGSDTSGSMFQMQPVNTQQADSETQLPLLHIKGGTILVNASGDGLDSNGNLVMDGGYVIVDGPDNSGNGSLDSGSESGGSIMINGGTLLAIGASGMSEAPGEAGSQCSFQVNAAFSQGSVITITDDAGNTLMEYTAQKSGDSIIFSAPSLALNETYTVSVDGQETQITQDSVVTGASQGTFRMGGHGGQGFR